MANKKKPQDRKPENNQIITVETPCGTVRIKKFNVKAGFLRKNRHEDEIELMFKILELHANEKTLETIDELNMEQLKEFFLEWQEQSGVNLGESYPS